MYVASIDLGAVRNCGGECRAVIQDVHASCARRQALAHRSSSSLLAHAHTYRADIRDSRRASHKGKDAIIHQQRRIATIYRSTGCLSLRQRRATPFKSRGRPRGFQLIEVRSSLSGEHHTTPHTMPGPPPPPQQQGSAAADHAPPPQQQQQTKGDDNVQEGQPPNPTYPENAADALHAFPLRTAVFCPLVPEGSPPVYKPTSPALCFQVGGCDPFPLSGDTIMQPSYTALLIYVTHTHAQYIYRCTPAGTARAPPPSTFPTGPSPRPSSCPWAPRAPSRASPPSSWCVGVCGCMVVPDICIVICRPLSGSTDPLCNQQCTVHTAEPGAEPADHPRQHLPPRFAGM